MSLNKTTNWEQSQALQKRIGEPPTINWPDKWTLSTSWQRAQKETDYGGPLNAAERIVCLEESNTASRVIFALKGRTLRGECECSSGRFNGYCAHLYSCWWRWIRGDITVCHLQTGRQYDTPPEWMSLEIDTEPYHRLTPAELDAYLTCQVGSVGVREWARHTNRSPGTVGNLLRNARSKMK